ncbi:MAG: hypothetical protein DRH93_02530 [Deltaproteobacteria bacterium]|nr:MAG: hypothetical protein DRH93_02530 [Deltaproteobacteria bacterium]
MVVQRNGSALSFTLVVWVNSDTGTRHCKQYQGEIFDSNNGVTFLSSFEKRLQDLCLEFDLLKPLTSGIYGKFEYFFSYEIKVTIWENNFLGVFTYFCFNSLFLI